MICIVDYGAGNLHSVQKAFERAALDRSFKGEVRVSSSPQDVLNASHVVLPGVGAFGDCRAGLFGVTGLVSALETAVLRDKKPFLGICVGMQLLATRGLEHGSHEGLGWIEGEVSLITPSDPALKIPHMGWNELEILQPHKLLEGIDKSLHGYFVHSYHFTSVNPENLVARTDYGGKVTAIVAKDNIFATQFHPEKSQALGLALLGNFLQWNGKNSGSK